KSAMALRRPLRKLSRQVTRLPSPNKRRHRWLPRKPAPPVTKTLALSPSLMDRSYEREQGLVPVLHKALNAKTAPSHVARGFAPLSRQRFIGFKKAHDVDQTRQAGVDAAMDPVLHHAGQLGRGNSDYWQTDQHGFHQRQAKAAIAHWAEEVAVLRHER